MDERPTGYVALAVIAAVRCANGNRTHAYVSARSVDATTTFDAADRIATSAEATYTTDADGFVTSKETSAGTTTYRYSALGELTTVTVPSRHTITYAYDAFSRRVSRSVDGTVTDRYLWADATHLLAVYPATGTTPTYRFTYADGRVPASVETSAGTFRLVTDQVGTVRALVASDGTITQRVERDSYGAVTSGTAGFPLGFAGGLTDADTGLVHFGAREYDPALGRWLSRDPIDFAGGDANLYAYVLGDPVGGVDPEGLDVWTVSVRNWDAAWIVGRGSSSGVVWDDQGHMAHFRTTNDLEIRSNISASTGITVQHYNFDCIYQIEGRSATFQQTAGWAGRSFSWGSIDAWDEKNHRWIEDVGSSYSLDAGFSVVPYDRAVVFGDTRIDR
ncbi:MAG TPA: RHS repeat-associated core domain-containing protein [Coriobacteriia bacterium]